MFEFLKKMFQKIFRKEQKLLNEKNSELSSELKEPKEDKKTVEKTGLEYLKGLIEANPNYNELLQIKKEVAEIDQEILDFHKKLTTEIEKCNKKLT